MGKVLSKTKHNNKNADLNPSFVKNYKDEYKDEYKYDYDDDGNTYEIVKGIYISQTNKDNLFKLKNILETYYKPKNDIYQEWNICLISKKS